jgi:hypothetical protein
MKLEMLPLPDRSTQSDPQSSPSEGVSTRLLTPSEISSLEPIFKEHGAQDLPDPATSFVVGSVDANGKVVAFLVMQLKVHAQPMWIQPGHEALFRSLVNIAEKTISERVNGCWIYLFAEAGRHSKLASHVGMKLEPWNVYSKFIKAEAVPELEEVIQ